MSDESSRRIFPLAWYSRGFWLTGLVAAAVLLAFFGPLVFHANSVYFGASGDGMQSYFTILYHVQHDTSFWQFDGMNYPFGEQVFFTGCMPLITNALILLRPVIDLTGYTVGIVNLSMLFSIVVSAQFLFLILQHFRVSSLVSIVTAVGIAFLSPQIDRLGGHYSLTFQFIIPLALWKAIGFYEDPTWKKALIMGFWAWIAATLHFYLFAFVSLIFGGVGLYRLIENRFQLRIVAWQLLFWVLQVGIPLFAVQALQRVNNPVTDRTSHPWGFFEYLASPAGILLSENRFYSPWLNALFSPTFPQWEGRSFVGLLTFLGVGIVLISWVRSWFRAPKNVCYLSKDPIWNALLWTAVVAFALAIGIPFVFPWGKPLMEHIGILRQLRGVGRFAWVFYYVVSLYTVLYLYRWSAKRKGWVSTALFSALLGLLVYDAWKNVDGKDQWLNNRFEILEDEANQLAQNKWISSIQKSDFAAIIPLPYVHIGSENIWIYNETDIQNQAYFLSLKTGIPLYSVSLSRTSLRQTYANYALLQEPYRPLEILKHLPKDKDFLVLVKPNELKKSEQEWLKNAQKLYETPAYHVYRLAISSFQDAVSHARKRQAIKALKSIPKTRYLASDSLCGYRIEHFDELATRKKYRGKGAKPLVLKQATRIFDEQLPFDTDSLILSFWVSDFTTDLTPRTTMEIAVFYEDEKVAPTVYYFQWKDGFQVIDGEWALIEYVVELPKDPARLQVTVWNDNFVDRTQTVFVDEWMLYPADCQFGWEEPNQAIVINNRTLRKP